MKKIVILSVCLMALAMPAAFAQKIYIDYDPDYDRDSIETFAWRASPETSASNGLLHSRIMNAIEHYLSQAGFREVDADPDVWVTYHTDSEKELALDTTTLGYGYSSSMYWSPYRGGYYGAATTTTVREYSTGTLIVDVWDAKTDRLIWRGSASGIVVPDNPAKRGKKVDTAIGKMVKKWESYKRKADKRRG